MALCCQHIGLSLDFGCTQGKSSPLAQPCCGSLEAISRDLSKLCKLCPAVWCSSSVSSIHLLLHCFLLPPTLHCTSCTESSFCSQPKMQICSTASTVSTLSSSTGFPLPLSTCSPHSLHQFSVALQVPTWCYPNVKECGSIFTQLSRKIVLLVVFLMSSPKVSCLFSARGWLKGRGYVLYSPWGAVWLIGLSGLIEPMYMADAGINFDFVSVPTVNYVLLQVE